MRRAHLIEHDLHRRAAKMGEVLVLVELLGSCQDLAPPKEVPDPVPLLQPAPVLMRAVELHVASKQPAALGRSDRLALLHDLLADSQPVANIFPGLLESAQPPVRTNQSVARRSHHSVLDHRLVVGAQIDRDEEHSNVLAGLAA